MIGKDLAVVSDAPSVDEAWLQFLVELPFGRQPGGRDA
jgi:hypothetical protein